MKCAEKGCRKHADPSWGDGRLCWRHASEECTNKEINRIMSRPHMYAMGVGQIPEGKRVKYAYAGTSGGVWTVDEDGRHWAGTSERTVVPC